MEQFHSADYIQFLRRVQVDDCDKYAEQMVKYNVGNVDCPIFDGLFSFCQTSVGGSIDGARKLMSGSSDISINWAGGLHHAKKCGASGFCYTNDIVLAILELLKFFPRVLYIDIDVHHGDGVEEAFYVTDRVMTVSFHEYGDNFFPGTGSVFDKGAGAGDFYSVNCPLKKGITDESYHSIFKPVIQKVMDSFRPSAIVLQCGADSLSNDCIGGFNMTVKGHAECVSFVKSFGVPTLVLGGGGYNIRSVAKCWTYETAALLDVKVDGTIPFNDYWTYYHPDFSLHFPKAKNRKDMNSPKYIDMLREKILENLRNLTGAPSVQFQEFPPIYLASNNLEDDD